MKKNVLLLFVLMLLPMVASADAIEIDGIYYNLVSKIKQAEVTSNPNSYSGSVDIPATVEYENITYNVTSIGANAFSFCKGLTSITIPNSVTAIGESAFWSCSDLTSVTIPNSVTSIGGYAFMSCTGLTSVTIGNSVTSIGYMAFSDCTGLTSVHITDLEAWCKITFGKESNPLTYIHHLFINGKEIKDLVIPNGVTSIGIRAFESCTGLTSVTIPNSVASIGNFAFSDCTGLTSVTIGNSVTSIGSGAFGGCTGLTSVTIPNSVTSIGHQAFSYCSALTSIAVENANAIYDSRNNCNAIIETMSNTLLFGCKTTIISDGITTIGGDAFTKCIDLTSISIPNSVKSIGNNAFRDCSGLTSVTIGSGVKTIESQAFANCKELADVYCYAEKVPSTQSDAFYNSYIEYATLHVPEVSLEDYKTTSPWSGFGKKVSIESSSVETIDASGTTISNHITLDGQRVEQPRKGVNIVRMSDGTVKKVMVK